MKKRMFTLLMTLVMVVSLLSGTTVLAAEGKSDDIVILYTNDVHTYIDGALSYDVIAGLKSELEEDYEHVLLLDAGDHVQGTAYGSMDKGKTIIDLMNAAGYDAATLGNHEFDYGMEGAMNVIEWASYPYISANFYHETNGTRGEDVLDNYILFECGDEKVAIVGVTTPETFTKTTPAYFQDGNGNYIYGISGGDDGAALRADFQLAIDEAKAAGATVVIALGHLGDDPASMPWTSEETIAAVSGLDAFIDGHSHSTVVGKEVAGKDGEAVLLTQTGEYFNAIGKMVIDSETGAITTELLGEEALAEVAVNAEVKAMKDAWMAEIDTKLGAAIGTLEVSLENYQNGERLVRKQETNAGDFAADALYYLFDNMDLEVDVAIMNGGGIRNKEAVTGEISYKDCKDIHTFGNVACLQTVSGRQILDALEWGAKDVGNGENGGFLQVAGLMYSVNTTVESTVQMDDKGVWIGAPTGEYRVQNVMIYNKEQDCYDALDLEAEYNLAGYNYTLRDLGDGYAMFEGAVNVLDYVMEDYLVLANYVQGFEGGVVGASNSPLAVAYPGYGVDYATINGAGRICLCADIDNNHSCDACGLTMTECVDADHNHYCDICGWPGAFPVGCCEAKETGINGAYTELTYSVVDGKPMVSGKVEIYSSYYADNERAGFAPGSVQIQWVAEDTEFNEETGEFTNVINKYPAEPVSATLNEEGKAVVEVPLMPVDMLDHGNIHFTPADTAAFLPATNGLLAWAQDNIGKIYVDVAAEYSINGLPVGNLYAMEGSEVTITILEEGYDIILVDVADEEYNYVDYKVEGTNIIFTMPAGNVNVVVNPLKPGDAFEDVPADAYYAEAVFWAVKNGITAGTSPTEFSPDAPCTRAQAVTFLWAAAGYPEAESTEMVFTDVSDTAYYRDAVLWAYENGITGGTSATTFSPDATCTRAQIMTFLWKTMNAPVLERENEFIDVAAADYFYNAVQWACENGITAGVGNGMFGSAADCTRAHIVMFLYRCFA